MASIKFLFTNIYLVLTEERNSYMRVSNLNYHESREAEHIQK